jgi:hypothetical protein
MQHRIVHTWTFNGSCLTLAHLKSTSRCSMCKCEWQASSIRDIANYHISCCKSTHGGWRFHFITCSCNVSLTLYGSLEKNNIFKPPCFVVLCNPQKHVIMPLTISRWSNINILIWWLHILLFWTCTHSQQGHCDPRLCNAYTLFDLVIDHKNTTPPIVVDNLRWSFGIVLAFNNKAVNFYCCLLLATKPYDFCKTWYQ